MVSVNKDGYMLIPCPKCGDHHTIVGGWNFREHLRRIHGMRKAAATKFYKRIKGQSGGPHRSQMRQLKVRSSKTALLTLTRSRQWTDKMVYILATNKSHKYEKRPLADLIHRHNEKGGQPARRIGGEQSERGLLQAARGQDD